ncbi:serine-threonine/tyrosine-protein kinase catalytic domain-containing protein [Tanacetum coccineum]
MELYFETLGQENETLHRFDYETISVATGNFSDQNKILQLTSDSLYKNRLTYSNSLNMRIWPSCLDIALREQVCSSSMNPACTLLNMDKRYKILLSVAKALLYLHKDAPIRVIHYDVRSGNILLDESLDPKLSNFGTARCLASDETDCYIPMTGGTWFTEIG